MVLRSIDFLWYYGKIQALIDNSYAVNAVQLTEEEREIEELIDSMKNAKKKVIKEGVLYKYNENAKFPRILSGGFVVNSRNIQGNNEFHTYQISKINTLKPEHQNVGEGSYSSELDLFIQGSGIILPRYMLCSSIGTFGDTNVAHRNLPSTSLF